MAGKKPASRTDLEKVDAHVIAPEEYEEIPELTDEDFSRGEIHVAGVKVSRGRPRLAQTKQPLKIRIDRDVIAAFRATGPGWQTRMNDALRQAAGLIPGGAKRLKRPTRPLRPQTRLRRRA